MTDRRLRPRPDLLETRNLLAASHPTHHLGTITADLVGEKAQPPGGVATSTFEVTHGSGSLTPYGKVGLTSSFAIDHTLEIGLETGNLPIPNRQTFELTLTGHGHEVASIELDGPPLPVGTPLQAGQYTVTFDNADATKVLATGTATVKIPKGLPTHAGQLRPVILKIDAK